MNNLNPLDTSESKILDRRFNTFLNNGLLEEEAEMLAKKMMERDRDEFDDRRVCFECTNFIRSSARCRVIKDRFGKPSEPIWFVLQRCEKFNLKGVR